LLVSVPMLKAFSSVAKLPELRRVRYQTTNTTIFWSLFHENFVYEHVLVSAHASDYSYFSGGTG
jgi:hypothetical protein